MPKRDVAPVGAPCWVDLFTRDPDASRAFYGELLGWTSVSAGDEFGGYINFSKDGEMVAGAMRNNGEAETDLWSIYLASKDAQATVDAAVANGGTVELPPMAVGDLGTMAIVHDPADGRIGVWQPGLHRGFGEFDEPGTPAWFELHTREFEPAVAFYRDVFGVEVQPMSDTPEFRYSTLGEGETQYAGIMDASGFLPAGDPGGWSLYFRVADTDASLARAVELGATLVVPAEDTPYGRLATLTDVTGAQFRLVGGSGGS